MTAGLWLFLIHLLTGYPKAKPILEQPPQDAEVILQQAQQQLREVQAKNRERAVQAITQKNNLLAEQDKTQKVVNNLQAKAELALKNGDPELERQLLEEAERYQATLSRIQVASDRATKTVESIKDVIRREEQRIRDVTTQAMTAKVEWRQRQISASIEELSHPAPLGTHSSQEKLDAMLRRIESTRVALGREAEAALRAENYTVAIRLLAEQQNLEHAIIFGSNRL